MRKKVFRGKRKDTREWVYGFLADDDKITVSVGTYNNKPVYQSFYIYPETAGLYTGQQDPDGRGIAEDDIVKDNYGNIGVVKYSDFLVEWRIHFHIGCPYLLDAKEYGMPISEWIYPKIRIKVIGNIHDNPELLGRE